MSITTTSARAIVTRGPHKEGKWTMEDVTLRPIGDNELLVRMVASGICHTDVVFGDAADDIGGYPRIMGHEGKKCYASISMQSIDQSRLRLCRKNWGERQSRANRRSCSSLISLLLRMPNMHIWTSIALREKHGTMLRRQQDMLSCILRYTISCNGRNHSLILRSIIIRLTLCSE